MVQQEPTTSRACDVETPGSVNDHASAMLYDESNDTVLADEEDAFADVGVATESQHAASTVEQPRPIQPLHPLNHHVDLQITSRTDGNSVWGQMKCPQGLAHESECNICKRGTTTVEVLGARNVMLLSSQMLECKIHGRRFTLAASPELWAQVERMEHAGEVYVHPHLVVLSARVRVTMEAYR